MDTNSIPTGYCLRAPFGTLEGKGMLEKEKKFISERHGKTYEKQGGI